jgi:hypothetical protein
MKKHARSLVRVIEENIGRNEVKTGAEIGVWKGELSADLLNYFPNLHLVMVDLWEAEDETKSMHGKDSSQEAMEAAMRAAAANTQEFGARSIFRKGKSVDIAESYNRQDFDFVFIDADHFYESVRADLLAWFPLVKEKGIIAGHDYNGMGDKRKGWGVKHAVDEFFGELQLEIHTEPGLIWWVKKW